MTADDFTTAASDRALSIAMETSKPGFDPENHPNVYRLLVDMAEWARTHLAAQELTHDEVAFGGLAMRDQAPDDTPDWPDWVWARFSRAALTAARKARP